MPSTPGNSGKEQSTMQPKSAMRQLDRGTPGEPSMSAKNKTPEQKILAKKRSQYYEDIFASRESNNSARERINRESMVIAEVRTNVIIPDEFTFTTELSYSLSSRYQRPESSILITITHSASILLGGSFDPAYTVTITALPSQLQPVTNQRNAILLQNMFQELLSVPPSRGVVKFIQLAEENFAFNGRTYSAQIEDLEKEQGGDMSSLKRTLSRSGFKSGKTKSMRNMRSQRGNREVLTPHPEQPGSPTPSAGLRPSAPGASPPPTIPLPEIPQEKSALDKKAEKVQKMRRKSFMSGLFGKHSA